MLKEETTTTTRVDVYAADAGMSIDSNFVGDLLRGRHDAKNDGIESHRFDLRVNSEKKAYFIATHKRRR